MGRAVAGKALAAKGIGSKRSYLRTKNVFDGRIDLSDVLSMPMTEAEFARYVVRYGDVLLNEGQSLDLVGRCAMYRDESPSPIAIQNQLIRFRANPGVSHSFAAHLFRFCQATGVFAKIALQTTSVAHLGVSRFNKLQLPWPDSRAEQAAIGAVLDSADGLMESLEQLLAKKRLIKQGAMHGLLSGTRRIAGFAGPWALRRFSDLATPRKAKVDPRASGTQPFCVELEHIGAGSGVLNGSVVAGRGASLKTAFQAGDVLFGKLRAYLKKYWRADRSGVCSTEIWALVPVPAAIVSEYLFQVVQTGRFIKAASEAYGTHMPRSDWKVVRNYELKLPLDLDEQAAIAAVLSDMDAELAALQAKLDKARLVKQGMMQNLLTGKIRLV